MLSRIDGQVRWPLWVTAEHRVFSGSHFVALGKERGARSVVKIMPEITKANRIHWGAAGGVAAVIRGAASAIETTLADGQNGYFYVQAAATQQKMQPDASPAYSGEVGGGHLGE